jgi:hypothetical protein
MIIISAETMGLSIIGINSMLSVTAPVRYANATPQMTIAWRKNRAMDVQ